MTLLVAMFAVAGCVYMLESVFFLNVEVFNVNDSVGERIRVFSVGNVELIFKNWFKNIIDGCTTSQNVSCDIWQY